jgi:hypothetical protein
VDRWAQNAPPFLVRPWVDGSFLSGRSDVGSFVGLDGAPRLLRFEDVVTGFGALNEPGPYVSVSPLSSKKSTRACFHPPRRLGDNHPPMTATDHRTPYTVGR